MQKDSLKDRTPTIGNTLFKRNSPIVESADVHTLQSLPSCKCKKYLLLSVYNFKN